MQQQTVNIEREPSASPVVLSEKESDLSAHVSEVDRLLQDLQAEALRQKRERRQTAGILVAFTVFFLILFPLAALHARHPGHSWHVLRTFLTIMPIMVFGIMAGTYAVSEKRKKIVRKMVDHLDVRLVGPLAEALGYQEKELRKRAAEALPSILLKMRASDASLLNTAQRNRLNQALLGRNKRLVLAILAAYEQVGDSAAIPPVSRLAAGEGLAVDSSVQEAAQRCLLFLQQRAKQEQAAQTLLRASTNADTNSLLRAADSSPKAAPQQLLRASTPEQT